MDPRPEVIWTLVPQVELPKDVEWFYTMWDCVGAGPIYVTAGLTRDGAIHIGCEVDPERCYGKGAFRTNAKYAAAIERRKLRMRAMLEACARFEDIALQNLTPRTGES